MVDINQYTVKPREIVEMIIKAAGIHEGEWWLGLGYGFAPGNFGPNDAEIAPGVAVVVQNFLIQRVLPSTVPKPPAILTVDAAKVNPKS